MKVSVHYLYKNGFYVDDWDSNIATLIDLFDKEKKNYSQAYIRKYISLINNVLKIATCDHEQINLDPENMIKMHKKQFPDEKESKSRLVNFSIKIDESGTAILPFFCDNCHVKKYVRLDPRLLVFDQVSHKVYANNYKQIANRKKRQVLFFDPYSTQLESEDVMLLGITKIYCQRILKAHHKN